MSAKPPYTPHPPLHPHYASLDDKQPFLRKVFDESAEHYERIASWGFFGTGDWYRRSALRRAGLTTGQRVVDVAAGTGITARAAAEITGDASLITCVEPSAGMLQESARRLPAARHLQAMADAIPLPDGEFDFLSMGFALRHVEDLAVAFGEFHRLLKPGGRLLIMDITKPDGRLANALTRLYFRDLMPRLTRLMTGSREAQYLMEYYWETLNLMVEPERVLEALATAGFQAPVREVQAGIFSEYTARKA